jgi:two-component system sensor histidine kinase/response regulator
MDVNEEVEEEMTYPVFDQEAALSRVDNDMELFREIASLFFDDSANLMGEIRDALKIGDAKKLERGAHTLKGSVSNFFAKGAYDAALKLEIMGREGKIGDAKAALSELDRQIERLVSALWTFAEEVVV